MIERPGAQPGVSAPSLHALLLVCTKSARLRDCECIKGPETFSTRGHVPDHSDLSRCSSRALTYWPSPLALALALALSTLLGILLRTPSNLPKAGLSAIALSFQPWTC